MLSPILTIAIPTFSRASKLRRLLCAIRNEIMVSHLKRKVVVLVSDNASPDETPEVVEEFGDSDLELTYHRQPDNLGFDGNLRYLYLHASTPYIWFIADDDLPLAGAVAKVVTALEAYDPDVLLFSFIQPPGSTVRQFDYPEPVRLVSDPVSAIEHILRYTKVSIFVIRKVDFDDSQWRVLDENLGAGWYYISLAFSVLEASRNLRLAAISELLATCDEDWFVITTAPVQLLLMETAVQHPFVLKYCPSLSNFYRDKGYYIAIQFAFAVKAGSLLPEYPQEYEQFIKELEFRGRTLLRRPQSLLQFMTLKLRIASWWPKIKPMIQLARKRSAAASE